MPTRLAAKTAVITGGTHGLGQAMAEAFLAEGAQVVCAGRTAASVPARLSAPPGRLHYVTADVRDIASVKSLMYQASAIMGRIDIMVANAGIHHDSLVTDMLPDQWEDVIATNLTGTFNCTHAVLPYMRAQGAGRIINVSSAAATRVNIGQASYCASKAGVEMFTKVCAVELGRYGILVNCLQPGVISEGMGRDLQDNPRAWQRYHSRFALRRPGEADELAAAAVFLAGEESSYVNGHVLEVNGGLMWA